MKQKTFYMVVQPSFYPTNEWDFNTGVSFSKKESAIRFARMQKNAFIKIFRFSEIPIPTNT